MTSNNKYTSKLPIINFIFITFLGTFLIVDPGDKKMKNFSTSVAR